MNKNIKYSKCSKGWKTNKYNRKRKSEWYY